MTARRAGRGFTLLEVMVALAILATSLLAISDVVAGALRNQVRARNLALAALLARGKMAALEGFGLQLTGRNPIREETDV